MKKGRKIALITGVSLGLTLALVLVVTWIQRPTESYEPNFSTYFTDSHGTHALYRSLETEGFEVDKSYYRIYELDTLPMNLVCLGGFGYFNIKEVRDLFDRVRKGSFALISEREMNPFLHRKGVKTRDLSSEAEYYSGMVDPEPASPSPLFLDIEKINFMPDELGSTPLRERINSEFAYHYVSDSLPLIPLLENEGRIHLAYIPYGKGRLYVITSPWIFTNQGLRESDNAKLALGLFQRIQAEHPAPFIFDEFHHGFQQTRIATPMNQAEFRWMIWGLLFTFVLMVWSFSRRAMKPVPLARHPRRSMMEFVASMAQLHHKKRGTIQLYQEIRHRFQGQVRNALGLASLDDLDPKGKTIEAAGKKWGRTSANELLSMLRGSEPKEKDRKALLHSVKQMRKFSIKHNLDHHGH